MLIFLFTNLINSYCKQYTKKEECIKWKVKTALRFIIMATLETMLKLYGVSSRYTQTYIFSMVSDYT